MPVHIGFTPEGKPWSISDHHICVTGITNISGKTTTVEALLRRREKKALVFLTKRGEKTFSGAREIPPFYMERFDWEYMRSLLEAAMKEKLKFETPWIMRVCKGADNAFEVRERLGEALRLHESGEKKLRGIDYDQYTLLAGYLDKILPTLRRARRWISEKLDVQPGLNVMDLRRWYRNHLFQLVIIRDCMEWILQNENDCTVALPEAWKMLPQGRNTPVKLYFEYFIREGATNGNYLIIDAQDLRGVEKMHLTNVSIWVIGKMMQANEVERLVKQTIPSANIKAEDVMSLKLGHFIVVDGVKNTVQKVYVQPHGVPDELAIRVARGELEPEVVKEWLREKLVEKTEAVGARLDVEKVDIEIDKNWIKRLTAWMKSTDEILAKISRRADKIEEDWHKRTKGWRSEIVDIKEDIAFLERHIGKAEVPLKIEHVEQPVKIVHTAAPYEVKTTTVVGKILFVAIVDIKGNFTEQVLSDKMLQRGWNVKHETLAPTLGNLVKSGRLIREPGSRPAVYELPPLVDFKTEEHADVGS
ncbi:MAG: hypothetical protein OEZ48_00250 [Candidatus Bathyarchaeota archaeon]|nr:hypothetical protein [Candidatus Bathyarchaeota archaeon]MDH5686287.1 hypothetical protein [Candidatus Bathyarchaeota archaeon]